MEKQESLPAQVKATVSNAKEQAQQAVENIKQKAVELLGQAKDQLTDHIVTRKDSASGMLNQLAGTLRDASTHLKDDMQGPVGQSATVAADQVGRLANYLQERDINEITNDTERFARQQPALFLGGAFFLGVLAARFLRASERNMAPPPNGHPEPWNEDRAHALVPVVATEPLPTTKVYTAHNYVPGGVAGQGNSSDSGDTMSMSGMERVGSAASEI